MSLFKPAKPVPPPRSKVARPSPSRATSESFEPLPQPEVIESDSDTSWGLWQESVNSLLPEEDADLYKDTVPMGLQEDPPPKKTEP